MGIRPNKGDKVERNYRIDGSTEAQQLINDSEHTGNEAGKVFAEIDAQASSSNKGMIELSKRVAALEGKTAFTSAVLTTGEKTGSWAPWDKTTCPPWLTIGSSSLIIPEGRWRIEVLKGQVVIYENGALKDRAPAGWDGVILGSSQVYDGTGNATLIVTKLY